MAKTTLFACATKNDATAIEQAYGVTHTIIEVGPTNVKIDPAHSDWDNASYVVIATKSAVMGPLGPVGLDDSKKDTEAD